jgi:colicin import membrane protein
MSTTAIVRQTCRYPGCGQPVAPAAGTGRPPEYCAGRGHNRVSAWRERRRLAAEQAGTTISPAEDGSPLTTAKMTGAELLRSLRAETDQITALGAGLRDRIDTLTDPTAAEAEVEAVRAAAEQRAATAEARPAAAEQRAATAEQLRAEADAAAEEMSEHLTAAQALAQTAGQRAAAAEQERDAGVAQARTEADERVAAAGAEQQAAIAQAPAEAGQRVRAAEAEREKARQAAADAGAAAEQAQQETARAQAVGRAAQAETGRVRAEAGKMLDQVRAEAARERDELRADLRARAERAERQADAYRDELGQLRAASHDAPTGNGSSPAGVTTTRRAARRTPAT